MSDLKQNKDILSQKAYIQQSTASDPKLSVWVEASAGTGKTKVLSDRVLRLLLNGVLPQKILCLTYTKAAAVEMKNRVQQKLAKWAVMSADDLREEIVKLTGVQVFEPRFADFENRARILFASVLDTPAGMKIQTIHSFCEDVLKRFPLEAGVCPYFEVMDETSSVQCLRKISHVIFEKTQKMTDAKVKDAVAYLTEHLKQFSFPDLIKTLTENRGRFIQTLSAYNNSVDLFLEKLAGKLEFAPTETILKDFVDKRNDVMLQKCIDALFQGSAKDVKNAQILSRMQQNFDFREYADVFLTQNGEKRKELAHKDAIAIFEKICEVMDSEAERVLECVMRLKKAELFYATKAIVILSGLIEKEYSDFKKKNDKLDYEDLIVLTKKLLEAQNVAGWVLYKLDGGISHVLLDEAQDTSPQSWAIIRALTAEFFAGSGQNEENRTLFIVGDRKQSIYGFQGADPDEFDRTYKHFCNTVQNFKKVRLDVSFRSVAAILDSVNQVFADENVYQGVCDDEPVKHIPYRLGEGGRVEILPIVVDHSIEDDVYYPPVERREHVSATEMLARQLALKIKEMVQKKDILLSKGRPVQFKDFMVLVQRRNAFVEQFVRACKNTGVQVTGVDKLRLNEQLAVQDLLSLAGFLLLESDDLALAEVLKSPLFGLDDDDLFKLCHNRENCSLWDRLKADTKYKDVVAVLFELKVMAEYKRPFEIFSYVLSALDGRKKFVARMGQDVKDCLDEFLNLTISFEKDNVPNLQNFVAYMHRAEPVVKRELEQIKEDAVRVMTVHASKGLQAPIVILPDTVRLPKTSKQAAPLWDKKDNLLYFPLEAKAYDDVCENIHQQNTKKAFEEYRRLLYVALTRAEDRLYITGYQGKNEADEKSWYKICAKTLEKTGQKDETTGVCVYVCPQSEAVKKEAKNDEIMSPRSGKSDFIFFNPEKEDPLKKPYVPSHMEENENEAASSPLEDNGHFYRRGLIIHKLLQLLPCVVDIKTRKAVLASALAKEKELSALQKNSIEREVLSLLEDDKFGFIFGPNSRAEVPVMGEADGKLISGQIDRLIVLENKIVIVDFKTNRPAAVLRENVPSAYVAQLEIYKKLLENIYQKPVEAYILWTNTASLMQI